MESVILIAPQTADGRSRLEQANRHHGQMASGLVTLAGLDAEAEGRVCDATALVSHFTTAFHTYAATMTSMLSRGSDVNLAALRTGLQIAGAYNPNAFRLAVVETELAYNL